MYKTEQPELFVVLEVSTHPLHSNFITCIGYWCAPGSSSNCQHCVFDHEWWTSHCTFLTHYTHTNQHLCSVHQLKTCWLYLVVKLCLEVVDFQLLHLECGTVYQKNFKTEKLQALLKSILRLTYSSRTLSSQPLMRLRLWFVTEFWLYINILHYMFDILPWHCLPDADRVYPGSQRHLKLPSTLTHCPFRHRSSDEHSFSSTSIQRHCDVTVTSRSTGCHRTT